MHSFYRATTRYPKAVVAIFVVIAALCALCKPLIAVNYDMNDYLPPDTSSTLALNAMDAEYDGGVPNARVMVKNVTIPEALAYKRPGSHPRRDQCDLAGRRSRLVRLHTP